MLVSTLVLIFALVWVFGGFPNKPTAIHAVVARKRPPLTRRHLILAVLGLGMIAGFSVLMKGDGAALGARFAAEGWTWFAAFDVAAYVDVVVLVAIIAASLRFRAAWTLVRSRLKRAVCAVWVLRRRSSVRAVRRTRRPPHKANSNDEGGWAGLALMAC